MRIRVSPGDLKAHPRIDRFVSEKTGITRSQVQRLLEEGRVLVNGTPAKANRKIRQNDLIEIHLPEKAEEALVPEDVPLEIPYMDGDLAVVEKPPGMVVYPSFGHARGTLMNALLFRSGRLAAVGGPLRPGVVHRLDKDTSGLMVVALSDRAYYALVEDFKERKIQRTYLALVFGGMRGQKGEISLKVGRSVSDRKRMSTRTRRGKEALTRWEVLERFEKATLLSVRLATGRTHQIRVHLASLGHPVLGDRTYGRKTSLGVKTQEGRRKLAFARQMLHAGLLGLTHPVTGKYLEFQSPPPPDMAEALRLLRGE